jgi:HAD superfamily hydrolase (TIGR01509 family)
MNKFGAIIFDLDGTIADTEPFWAISTRNILEKRGVILTDVKHHELNRQLRGKCLSEAMLITKNIYNLDDDHNDLRIELINYFDSIRHKVGFIAGCREFIEKVAKKYKIAIASNGSKDIVDKTVHNLSLQQYFGAHIYSKDDVYGITKPKPDIFIHTSKMLNIAPSECIVIEDSETGIEAAKNAGMFVIAINTSNMIDKLSQANIIAQNYDSISKLLEQ